MGMNVDIYLYLYRECPLGDFGLVFNDVKYVEEIGKISVSAGILNHSIYGIPN